MSDKRTNERLATMTVQQNTSWYWSVDEVHGPENDEVSDRLMLSTDAVCRSLDDLYRMSSRVRTAMNETMIQAG